jgi:nucleotide-binding universal stress UspA family protein
LKVAAKRFISRNIQVQAISIEGETRKELERKFVDLNPNLVIVGSLGLNPVSHFLFGSVIFELMERFPIIWFTI